MAARMLAIYGKGGIGKSFTTSNLMARLAFDGYRVLHINQLRDICGDLEDRLESMHTISQ